MDGIGGEVSHKIRSAIKAKLMELGAYADDELPDYIMVMVANKRSRQQMEDDLQLFLGDNTLAFTAWLHSVLNKLQQVSIANAEGKKALEVDKRKRPSTEEHRKEKKKKAKKEKEKVKDDKTEENIRERTDDKKKSNSIEEKTESPELRTPSVKQTAGTSKVNTTPSATKGAERKVTEDDEDEDFLNLKADIEADMWGDGEHDDASQEKHKSVRNIQEAIISADTQSVPVKSATLPQPEPIECTKTAELPSPDKVSAVESSQEKQSILPSPKQQQQAKPASVNEEVSSHKVEPIRPQPRIIKISETLRQEQETLNPTVKRATDPQKEKKLTTSVTPIIFEDKSEQKEDDAEIFARHIAHELRQLTQQQRSLAKLKIQQRLAKQVLLSHVVSQSQKKMDVKGDRKADQQRPGQRIDHRGERGIGRRDLRLTLRRDREQNRDRARVPSPSHIREREQRERERQRERNRDRDRGRVRDREHKPENDRKPPGVSSVVRNKPQPVLAQESGEKPDASVASIVRVKPRPRLPAALQANRSLILKAVAEAQKSVSKAPVRPLPCDKKVADHQLQQSSKADLRLQKLHRIEKLQTTKNKRGILPSRECLKKMSISFPGAAVAVVPAEPTGNAIDKDLSEGSDVTGNSIHLDSPVNLLIEVPTLPVGIESAKPHDVTRTENVLRWIEDVEDAIKSPPLSNPDPPLGETVSEAPQPFTDLGDGSEEIEEVNDAGNVSLSFEDEDDMDQTLGPDVEVLEPDNDAEGRESVQIVVREEPQSETEWSGRAGPQFVVTLDGLDPELLRSFAVDENDKSILNSDERFYDKRPVAVQPLKQQYRKEHYEPLDKEEPVKDQQDQEMQLREELLKQQALAKERKQQKQMVSVRPPVAVQSALVGGETPRVPAKRPASPVLVPEGPLPKVTAKVNIERCKFWPACILGEKCEFHHPTIPCKGFPNCKFGDRCLFIHPKCHYDSACTRPDCAYSHSSQRSIGTSPISVTSVIGTQAVQQPCKYFPNCKNISCPFIHPKVVPCRYGTYCTKLNCQFIHDDKFAPTKHKWIRH